MKKYEIYSSILALHVLDRAEQLRINSVPSLITVSNESTISIAPTAGQVHVTTLNQLPPNIRNQINIQIQQQKLLKKKQQFAQRTVPQKVSQESTEKVQRTQILSPQKRPQFIVADGKINDAKLKAFAENLTSLVTGTSEARDSTGTTDSVKQSILGLPPTTTTPQIITAKQLASLLPGGSTVQLKPVLHKSAPAGRTEVSNVLLQQKHTTPTALHLPHNQTNYFVFLPTDLQTPLPVANPITKEQLAKPEVAQIVQQMLMQQAVQQQLQKNDALTSKY